MSNVEDFEKIVKAMDESPIFLTAEAMQNVYLGYITKYLAQIADALNEMKEQGDGNDD